MTSPLIAPQQGTIGLPAERLAQLRDIAKARGTTIVGVVEAAIAQAIKAGEIPDTLPGFAEIVSDDDVLTITIRNRALPPLGRTKAQVVAAVLAAAAGGTDPVTGLKVTVGKGYPIDLDDDKHRLLVGRHAKAVLISLEEDGEITMRTATTPSIALDFAKFLRKQAQNLIALPPELEAQLRAARS